MYDNPWIYNGQPFTDEQAENYVGFIYLITGPDGKMYVGKKILFNKVAKPPLKGKTKRRISKKPSNWHDYYGSNEDLQKQIDMSDKMLYKREILHLCNSKSEMGYLESKELFARDVLLDDRYWNAWIKTRINGNQLRGFKIPRG